MGIRVTAQCNHMQAIQVSLTDVLYEEALLKPYCFKATSSLQLIKRGRLSLHEDTNSLFACILYTIQAVTLEIGRGSLSTPNRGNATYREERYDECQGAKGVGKKRKMMTYAFSDHDAH